MRQPLGITATLVGSLIVVTGLAVAIFSNAETWIGQLIVGGGITLLGLFAADIGWLVLRSR